MTPSNARQLECLFLSPDNRRRGFTLVELLIAMALMTLLMAGLWSMFGVYARVLEKSERRVSRSQLTRSLQDQLRDDLRGALAPKSKPDDQSQVESLSQSVFNRNGGSFLSDSDEPTSSAELDELESEPDLDSPYANQASEIVDEKWHDAQIEFFGNSHGLIMQAPIVDGATIPSHELEATEHQLGFANPIPNSVNRIIYFYLSRDDAQSQGYPGGLFRIKFTDAQLHFLPDQMDSNLIGLLEMLQPEWFHEPEDPRLQQEIQREKRELVPVELSEHEILEEENRLKDLRQSIDFLPEVSTFRMRYFDGRTWQSQWDSRLSQSLPVAVEVSFETENEQVDEELPNPKSMDAVDAAIREKELAEQETADEQGELAFDLDDEIRSSQTIDITPPNRFVVFIRPAKNEFDEELETLTESGFGSEDDR